MTFSVCQNSSYFYDPLRGYERLNIEVSYRNGKPNLINIRGFVTVEGIKRNFIHDIFRHKENERGRTKRKGVMLIIRTLVGTVVLFD